MLIFDQLRISDDGKRMYVNAHVNKADYFSNIYIKSITIMTADKVSETDPGSPTEDYIYKKEIEGEKRELNLVLTALDFTKTWETDAKAMMFKDADMGNTLFFVYVECAGTPSDCTPCRLEEATTLGAVFDENILYQKVMNYTKDLLEDCTVPAGFTDFILLWYAFKSAIETEHYVAAIRFFSMLFGIVGDSMIAKNCGCHG